MADIVPADMRSRMMSGIKGKNTKPEMTIRRALHNSGFRYRLHVKELPGKPDIVFPRWRAVIFIHGCFWHGHDCHLFRLPKTRTQFWLKKINGNVSRDSDVQQRLLEEDWRVATVWECSMRGTTKHQIPDIVGELNGWLKSSRPLLEIRGIE